jgi:hypothetical protein
MTSFARLRIIDWELVNQTNPKVLLETRDQTLLGRLTKMIVRADALFSDPSYSPADLVLKLFLVMKVVIVDLLSQRDELERVTSRWKRELATLKSCHTHPTVVFQCPHCPKVFETQAFVRAHIHRRHICGQNTQTDKPSAPPPGPAKVTFVEYRATEQEMSASPAELAAVLDHCDTLMRNQELQLRTEFNNRIRQIEEDRNVQRMMATMPPEVIPPALDEEEEEED